MEPHTHRIHVLLSALCACALTAQASQAATLQFDGTAPSSPSFWDPGNWFPASSPGTGDTAKIGSGGGTLYLGDTAAVPAQNREISRLHFNSASGTWVLNWGSNPVGGQSGGLSFAQDDPADFGIGIRVGVLGAGTSANTITFINAENSAAQAMNIAIGAPFPFPQGPGGSALQLFGTSPNKTTLHADRVFLQSDKSLIRIAGQAELAANYISDGSVNSQVEVSNGGILSAAGATLSGDGVALLVAGGGSAAIDYLEFGGHATGIDTMVQIGTDAPAFASGGTAFFRTAIASATNGGTAQLVVDGSGGALTAVTMGDFTGFAGSGGTVELLVKNGGQVSLNHAALINDDPLVPPPAIASDVRILVDGTGSSFEGAVDMPSDPSSGVLNSGARIAFTNGAECRGCNLNISGPLGRLYFNSNSRTTVSVGKFGTVTRSDFTVSSNAFALFNGGATVDRAELHVGADGSATVADTAAVDFHSIQIDAGGPSGAPANVTIMDANPVVATTEVIAGIVNVGSQFTLFGDGTKLGGDQVVAPSVGAQLTLNSGARLRIGDDPLRPDVALLAIGSAGKVTIDASAAVYIGDPLASASYQMGTITLAAGGHLYGNGLINGAGFSGGTHATVLIAGGAVHPGFSPGTLTIDGEYVQQDGVLNLEIGGVNPGEYDVLHASEGASFFGGAIRFVLLQPVISARGTLLDFFGGGGISFLDSSNVSIIDETSLGLDFDFSTGIATITHGAVVPIPPSAALFATGCIGLLAIGRRRQMRCAVERRLVFQREPIAQALPG